jgi:hypothetical protein
MFESQYHNYNDVITELQDYMLTNNLLKRTILYSRPMNTTTKITNVEKTLNNSVFSISCGTVGGGESLTVVGVSTVKKDVNHIFYPKQKDSLFWSFYIMVYGDVAYELIQPINLVSEKKIKIEYIEKIRVNKVLLKQHKYATLTHIENQLLNEQRIDIKTFFSLCVLEKMNVFYIHKKTYYDLVINKDDNNIDTNNSTFILYSSTNPKINNHIKYGFELGISEKIENFKKEFFHIENLEKPIKTISAYKLNDLLEYCKRLGIETMNQNNKTKNKKELYESLIQYF